MLCESGFLLKFIHLLVLCHWHWVILFPGVFLQLNLSFESAAVSADLLLLGRSDLADRVNLHTQCWWSLSIYCVRTVTTASKYFSYLSGCTLTMVTAVENLSHLMPFNRYQTFDLRSRPWYQYSIRFPRIICYLTFGAKYFYEFHAFFPLSCVGALSATSDAVVLIWFGLNLLEGMAKNAPLPSLLDLCCLTYGYRSMSLQI